MENGSSSDEEYEEQDGATPVTLSSDGFYMEDEEDDSVVMMTESGEASFMVKQPELDFNIRDHETDEEYDIDRGAGGLRRGEDEEEIEEHMMQEESEDEIDDDDEIADEEMTPLQQTPIEAVQSVALSDQPPSTMTIRLSSSKI